MTIIEIVLIGIGLSIDAHAVSITNGCVIKQFKLQHGLWISLFFGLFQAVMPLLGWSAGNIFKVYIVLFDHWIAFGLLLFVGAKMIKESRQLEPGCDPKNCLHFPTLIMLSLATSIDALAIGLSFSMLEIPILQPMVIIGSITFFICFVGTVVGNRIGHLFEKKMETAGGIVLIGIGCKIMFEHIVKNI